jgi:hypothetical protein
MATLTDILGFAESVSINDQRFVGQVISRNQRIATSEILTVVPFQFEFKPNNYLQYSKNRNLLANLRYFDKSLTQYLNFGSTGWVNYIAYQGDMTSAQIAACQWQTSSAAKNLVLGSLPINAVLPANKYIVKAGDFCQAGLYSYIATQDVLRGTGSTVTIPVHRNLINGPLGSAINAVIGQYGTTISMGGNLYTGTTFPVILQQYPQYTLVPITNDSFIAWNTTFKAFEAVL